MLSRTRPRSPRPLARPLARLVARLGAAVERLSLVALGAVGVAAVAHAQVPKAGDYYTDDTLYGFELKMPKNWEFVPPQPGQTSLIGKYDPKNSLSVSIGREESVWLHSWMIVFDRRPKPDPEPLFDEDGVTLEIEWDPNYRDVGEWIEDYMGQFAGWEELESEELKLKDKTVEGTKYIFTANGRSIDNPEVRAYAAVYEIEEDVEVAIVWNGPGEDKGWRKYEKAFDSMARTFRRVEIREIELDDIDPDFVDDGSPRSERLKLLYDEIQRNPGWEIRTTENYIVISNNDDEEFVEELMERIEKIRDIFVEDYPPEEARRVANDEDDPSRRDRPREDADEDTSSDDDENRSISVQADPFAEARASVVRICKNAAQYHSYGGPGGSAGYWSSHHRELVVYDDKAGGGRNDTWAVLNHEAFHQYIYYFYGEIAPHSWYNEGTGDFYAGYFYQHRKFKLKPFWWRLPVIANMLREERYVPLDELVRMTQGQYYSSSSHGTGPGDHYSQGWSFIWFLRQGPESCRAWNEGWDHILDTYLETLAETGDLDRSVDVAFDGVDWDEMTAAWSNFILEGR